MLDVVVMYVSEGGGGSHGSEQMCSVLLYRWFGAVGGFLGGAWGRLGEVLEATLAFGNI